MSASIEEGECIMRLNDETIRKEKKFRMKLAKKAIKRKGKAYKGKRYGKQ